MVPPTYCLADLAEQDLDPVKFETILSSANKDKKLKKQIEGVDSHRASAIMRKLRHATRASKGGLSCSSKQAVLAVRLTGTLVTSKSFVSKLQLAEQAKVLTMLLPRLHMPKTQTEAASIYQCLSRQRLSPQLLHQRAKELAVAIKHGLPSSYECESFKKSLNVLACLRQLFDQIPADFSARAHLWVPSLWRLLLVQPEAPYTEETRKDWAKCAELRQQALQTLTHVCSMHSSSLSKLREHIQEELLRELLGTPAGSLPAASHGLLSIMTAWTSACWDSGSAEKSALQGLSTEEKEVLAVGAINAWCCFLDLLGASFLTLEAAIGSAMTQVLCDVFTHSGSLVLLEAAGTAWKKLADTIMNAGQLSMRQELLLKPVIHMLKTCHTPDAYQATLGLWKHMVQLAGKANTGKDPASQAATWTLIADYSAPVLLALAAMPPGVCDRAGPGQDAAASSVVSQAIEWLLINGLGEGLLMTLWHKVVKKCSGIEGHEAQQSTNKPIQDAHKLVLTALVGETSRLMSHCSGRSMDGVQQVLLQTVANAGCNGLHEANFEAWQKLCDEVNVCKQLEVQQHFLLHIITEALAPDKGAHMHQAALAMWYYLLQLVCPVPSKASTAQRSLLVSFTAPVLLALAARPSAGLDHVEPLWLQVLNRWLDSWPHVCMLAALVSKLRYQIGINSSVTMSQADAQCSGIIQMQLLAAILQKMCCIMAEHCRSDSPAGVSFFRQYHNLAEELCSELCHQLVTFSAEDEGAKRASMHVVTALGACLMHMSSASEQVSMNHKSTQSSMHMFYCLLPSAVAMLGSCTDLIKAAPAHGQVTINLPDDTMLPFKALLPREWSRVCSMYWLVLNTGEDSQLAYQSLTHWQPGCAILHSGLSSSDYLPVTLDICSVLMRAIKTYMLAVDAFAESDEDVTAAVAFAAQVLQVPLEVVKHSVTAGDISVVRKVSADQEPDASQSPKAPSKNEGQGVVEFSGQDVVSWCTPWQDLYLVLAQVAPRNQACETDITETLAKYLLSFAAAMPQSDIHKAMPTSPSTASEFGLAMPASTVQPPPIPLHQAAASMSLWTCFLAADASVVVKQACRDAQASTAEAHMPVHLVELCIELLETSLGHLCHAAPACLDIGMGYISAMLDTVPDACASLANAQQPPMKAVAACIQLVDHVTDRKTALLLEEAWKAVLAAFKPHSMQSFPQSSVAELVLQPMAAALRHGSQAMQDMTQKFWGKGGIGSVLRGFDVSVVESALASLGHHNKLLPLKKAMSEGLLSTLSCLDDEGLEIEKDAGLADSPHIADAMTEGDNADAVAKMALALAQVEAAVKAHVQLASAGTDEMATTSCAHATRLTPARQDRTAEVTAKHAKRVTFAATPPNKASVAHVATTVTGAKPVQRRPARGCMVRIARRRQAAAATHQQQQLQQQQQMQASMMHHQLESQSELPPTDSACIGVCSDSQPDPSVQTQGDMDHNRSLDSIGQASGNHQQPREEHARSNKADKGSRQPNVNHWKGRTRGTACKDSCADEQPSAQCLQVASETPITLDSEPLRSHKTSKGNCKEKPRNTTQGETNDRGEGSATGDSRKHDKLLKEPSPQALVQSKKRKTAQWQKQHVAQLDSLDDVEPVKDGGEHADQACFGQHHPQQGSKQVAPVAGLQRLCKLVPKSSDGKPLAEEPDAAHQSNSPHQHVIITTRRGVAGPSGSELSEVEEETPAKSQKLSQLPSKPHQDAQAVAGTASLPASAHHMGHAAQAAQGTEGAKVAHAIKFSQTSRDALNKRDHSSQPDGSNPSGKAMCRQQAGCSTPVNTEVQAPGTQPQAGEEPRLLFSSPKCLQGQSTLDQPSQAMLALVAGHGGPGLTNQACLLGTSEPYCCGKRPAEYSPQAREVAYKRARGSMHDDSLDKQNVPTQGTYDTQPLEANLQTLGEPHSSVPQASLPADGLIGQGRQKAIEEAVSGRSSAAAHGVDLHDTPGICVELDNAHQVQEDMDSASVATVRVGSLVASSVATTEVVQASAMQYEYASTAQSARLEEDACFNKLPSKALGLTLRDAVVNQDQSNQDVPGQSTYKLDEVAHGRQPVTQDVCMQRAQGTALGTGHQQGGMGAPCSVKPASSSDSGAASRQASLGTKRHTECSSGAEMSALRKARDGTHVDQEPGQHQEGNGTSTEDMQVYAKFLVQADLASTSSLSVQELSAGSQLVQQILQAVNTDAKAILPEAAKQASRVASLLLKKAYASGYKDAKHEVAEHCMKTSC